LTLTIFVTSLEISLILRIFGSQNALTFKQAINDLPLILILITFDNVENTYFITVLISASADDIIFEGYFTASTMFLAVLELPIIIQTILVFFNK
jgi:hypothetical protein